MEIQMLSNLGTKIEGGKKSGDAAATGRPFEEVFELLMSRDLVTSENGFNLVAGEGVENEFSADRLLFGGASGEKEVSVESEAGAEDEDEDEEERQFVLAQVMILSSGASFQTRPLTEAGLALEENGPSLKECKVKSLEDLNPDLKDDLLQMMDQSSTAMNASIGPQGFPVEQMRPQSATDAFDPREEPIEALGSGTTESQAKTERLWGYWLRSRGKESAAEVSEKPMEELSGEHFPKIISKAGADASAVFASPLEGKISEADKESPDVKSTMEPLDSKDMPPVAASQTSRLEAVQAKEIQPLKAPIQARPSIQVLNAVKVLVSRGGDSMTVRLEPDALGKVEIVLVRDQSGVTAHFRVETPQAQQAIAGDVASLRNALEAKGVPVAHVVVDLNKDHDQQSAAENKGQSRKRRGGGLISALDDGEDFPGGSRPEWRPWGFEALI